MILVTGASGTVGTEVVKSLLGLGHQPFRAGYRSRPQNVPQAVEAVRLDFEQPQTLAPALRDVQTLFLLSSTIAHEAGIVQAAKDAGVERVVKLSVWGALEEQFEFARWHRAVERLIEVSGLSWTFLRPGGYMQNVVNYMGQAIRERGEFYSAAAEAPISHIDARDIGAVAARVLSEPDHDGRAYELSGPEAITYHDMAATLTRAVGREIRCVAVSDEDYKKGAMAAGTPEAYADALVDLDRYYRADGMSRVTPTVPELLDRDATPFEKFAQDHAHLLR